MKITYVVGIIVLLLVGFFVFFPSGDDSSGIKLEEPDTKTGLGEEGNVLEGSNGIDGLSDGDWRNMELVDISTGDKFTIDQFDLPVVLESFAVWCPTCTKQQREIKELHEDVGDVFISVSLDTDPNEDKQKVLNHIDSNGFDWYYAIAPSDLTQSLIDEFGIGVINAPSAPVILIDSSKNARFLHSGIKSANELKGKLRL